MVSNLDTNILKNNITKEIAVDEKLNSEEINLDINKNNKIEKINASFENYMTEFETREIGHIIKIIPLFLDSVIDMFNNIIDFYECNKKLSYINKDRLFKKLSINIIKHWSLLDIILYDETKNKEIIFSVIEVEKNKGKTIFEVLINLKFKELYDYFIHNGTILTWGWKIYDISDIFKTLERITKNNKELKNKEYNLELLDKMEIETINLDNSNLSSIYHII